MKNRAPSRLIQDVKRNLLTEVSQGQVEPSVRHFRDAPKELARMGRWTLVAMLALAQYATATQNTTVYVDEHYEVRAHDEPVKYVFNGETRVARISGSITANLRVQRLRLNQGWNLCSVAVGGLPLPRRLAGQSTDVVIAAHRWSPAARTWTLVERNDSLVAGTVLWLRASSNAILAVQGVCPDPAHQIVASGGSFHSSAGMTPTSLRNEAGDSEALRTRAAFDSASQTWRVRHLSIPMSDGEIPDFIAPGQAVFIQADAPVELEEPELARQVRYYHQDHLGSSSIITDADGLPISESAFYPFGETRHEVEEVEGDYGFAQKERDRESGLDYLEARYLKAALSRFATADPKYLSPESLSPSELGLFLARPQEMNLYAYAYNNPVRYHDPTGLDGEDKALSWLNDAAGLGAAGAEEATRLHAKKVPDFPLMSDKTAKVVKIGGLATSAISVAIKGWEFANDPSEATGAQLANEAAKALVGFVSAPVGMVWSGLDLAGVGPSQLMESTHNTIAHHKAATRAHERTTAAARGMRDMVNRKAPVINAMYNEAERGLKHFTHKVRAGAPKLSPSDPSLEQLNAQIKREEAKYRAMQRQLARERAKVRKAQAE